MTKEEAKIILLKIAEAVIEIINESPEGVPAGLMYAAFMAHGMSLDAFEKITDGLVAAGKIKRRGHLFFPA